MIREACVSSSQDSHSFGSDEEDDPFVDSEFDQHKQTRSPTHSFSASSKTMTLSSQDSIRSLPEITTTTEMTANPEPFVWIPFPENFKALLDSDFEKVMVQGQRHQLPARKVIADILSDFQDTVERGDVADLLPNFSRRSGVTRAFTQTNSRSFSDLQQLVDEFVNSVEIYINSISSTHLFYNEEEKEDFARQSAKGTECLGLIHLLRFLVVLPDFIQATRTMTKQQVSHLTSIMENFYFFLSKKQESFL